MDVPGARVFSVTGASAVMAAAPPSSWNVLTSAEERRRRAAVVARCGGRVDDYYVRELVANVITTAGGTVTNPVQVISGTGEAGATTGRNAPVAWAFAAAAFSVASLLVWMGFRVAARPKAFPVNPARR